MSTLYRCIYLYNLFFTFSDRIWVFTARNVQEENGDELALEDETTSRRGDSDSGSHLESTQPMADSPEVKHIKKMKAYWSKFRVPFPKPLPVEKEAEVHSDSDADDGKSCYSDVSRQTPSKRSESQSDCSGDEACEKGMEESSDSGSDAENDKAKDMPPCGIFELEEHCQGPACPACQVALEGGSEAEALSAIFRTLREERVDHAKPEVSTMKTPMTKQPDFFWRCHG